MSRPGDPSAGIRIRIAHVPDAAIVAGLVRAMAMEAEGRAAVTPRVARAFLSSASTRTLLAVAGGEPAGIMTLSFRPGLYHARPSLYIEELYVRPAFRRLGIASRFMEHALQLARRRRCAEVSVSTGLANRRAIALYEKHGLIERSLLLEKHLP